MDLKASQLKNTLENDVAAIFKKYIPFFSMYHEYVDSSEDGMRIVAEESKKKKSELVNFCSGDVSILQSLLISPVQRIPR